MAFQVGFVFSAVDVLSGPMIRMRREMGRLEGQASQSALRMQGAFAGLGVGIAGLIASAALLVPALSLAKSSANVELELRRVTLAMGVTGDAAVGLETKFRNSARSLSADLGVPINDTALAFQDFAKSGRSADEALADITPAAELSAASFDQLNVQQAANLAIQARAAFGITDTRKALNQLAAVTLKTRTDFKDLPAAIAKVSRGAQRMNVPLERAMLLFGLTRNVMDSATTSGTNVTRMLERMGKDSKSVAEFQRVLGVTLFDNQGNFRDTNDLIFEMIPGWTKLTGKQRTFFAQERFGTKAGLTFTATMDQLGAAVGGSSEEIAAAQNKLKDFAKSIDGSEDTIGKMARGQLIPMAGQLKLIEGRFGAIKDLVGPAFQGVVEPSVRRVADAFGSVVTSLEDFTDAQKSAVAKSIVSTGTFLGIAGGIITLASGIGFLGIGLKAAAGPLAQFARFLPGISLIGLTVGAIFTVIREDVGGAGRAFGFLTSQLVDLGRSAGEVLSIFSGGFAQGLRESLIIVGGTVRGFIGVFQGLAKVLGFTFDFLKDNESMVRFLGRAVGWITSLVITYKLVTFGLGLAVKGAAVATKLYTALLTIQGRAMVANTAAAKIYHLGLVGSSKALASSNLATLGLTTRLTNLSSAFGMIGSNVARFATKFAVGGGLVVAAGAAGVAFGKWADETWGLSNALAGVNRESSKFKKEGLSFLGDLSPGQRDALKQAKLALATAKADRLKLESGFSGRILSSKGIDFLSDTDERIKAAEDRIKKINEGGRQAFRSDQQTRDILRQLSGGAAPAVSEAANRALLARGQGQDARNETIQQLLEVMRKLPEDQAQQTKQALNGMSIFVDGDKLGEVGAQGNRNALASAGEPVGEFG